MYIVLGPPPGIKPPGMETPPNMPPVNIISIDINTVTKYIAIQGGSLDSLGQRERSPVQ